MIKCSACRLTYPIMQESIRRLC
uniref:Uncharacterized protein n=1 Tax=Arundo donax TaxID=35708 RepID=A0A0A9B4Y1_ARUDO